MTPVPGSGGGDEGATRTLVVHCPDWSVTAAGHGGDAAAVVVRANRVVAASPAARRAGITTGQRRRQAQQRCPHVTVVDHDPGRDARAFEAVAAAFDGITPRVEVTRPGTLAMGTRGPSRYLGGDDALARRVAEVVAALPAVTVGDGRAGVGVADGAFAALVAARRSAGPAAAHGVDGVDGGGADLVPLVVAPGGSAAFLAPRPVATLLELLDEADLVDVWQRLGLVTLGAVADLPAADVLARFGPVGATAHRLAAGLDARPLDARRPAEDRTVTCELDPPADRIDRAAFAAKALADELHRALAADGLACTHVRVEATTEHGEALARHWRHEGALTAGALADRVRWQLDGWLSGSATVRPSAGIDRLTLVPVEVVAARGRQLGFWGGETLVDERVLRAVARVQGLAGTDAVCVAELRGGRDPAARVVRVPVATVDLTAPRPAARPGSVTAPWPGRIPPPAPAEVPVEPEPVEVLDAVGRPVGVSGRAVVTAAPAHLVLPGRPPVAVTAWAGPWPLEECWWDPHRHTRCARFQLLDTTGTAHLVSLREGRWWRDGRYD